MSDEKRTHEQVIEKLQTLYENVDILKYVSTRLLHPQNLDCTKPGQLLRPILNPKDNVTSVEYLDGNVRDYMAKLAWQKNGQAQQISTAISKRFQILLDQPVKDNKNVWICVSVEECSRDYEVKIWLRNIEGNRRYRIYLNIYRLHEVHFLWDRVVELEAMVDDAKIQFMMATKYPQSSVFRFMQHVLSEIECIRLIFQML